MLGLSVLGLLFYYLMWLITDEEFREMLKYGWPWTSGMILVDYAACCLFTTVVTLYYWNTQRVGSLQAKRPFGSSAAVYSVDNINNGSPYWVIQRTWGHSIFEVELCQNPPPFEDS